MITNTGVLCVFKHLSNNNNDSHDRNECPFQTRQRDLGNKFLKMKLLTALSSSAWALKYRARLSSSLFILLCLYADIHFLSPKSYPSPIQALSVAGLGSGLTEAVVINPFEVVKVSLQANRDSFKEVDRNKMLF